MSESWIAKVVVTVHGTWKPDDEKSCTDLIAAVNDLRKPGNEKPAIRRGWWSHDEQPWLDVEIDRTSMRIDAGQHLVSVVLPSGSTDWLVLDDEDLDNLRPAVSR